VHLDRHGKVIKSAEFAEYPPDARAVHRPLQPDARPAALDPADAGQIDPPKVSLQLRESVGPSTVATVLRRAGVPDADPQTLATEPPMENHDPARRHPRRLERRPAASIYPPRGPL
jgi:hypothetical protein